MAEKSNLELIILIDYLRGTRKEKGTDSIHMLKQLVSKFPNRSRLFLYHTPRLNGIWKAIVPQRINEIVGVQHIKAYIFDDDLLISG